MTNFEILAPMHSLKIFIVVMLCNGIIMGQIDQISGVVLDGETEEPLAYASIYYDGTTTGHWSGDYQKDYRTFCITYS